MLHFLCTPPPTILSLYVVRIYIFYLLVLLILIHMYASRAAWMCAQYAVTGASRKYSDTQQACYHDVRELGR